MSLLMRAWRLARAVSPLLFAVAFLAALLWANLHFHLGTYPAPY